MPTENSASPPLGRVLVVDDSELNREIVASQLSALGREFDTAANGAEAVKMWSQEGFHAVLMDCHMPVLDGFGAACEIRRLEGAAGRTRIVGMTASLSEKNRAAALDAGMDEIIEKPSSAEVLARVLQAPAIDASVLAGKGLAALRPRLQAIFLRDAPGHLAELETAFENSGAERAARAAHALKGSSGNLGALELARLAGLMEERARSGGAAELRALLGQLKSEYARVERELTS